MTADEVRPRLIGGAEMVLPERDSAKAIRLRDDFNAAIHELVTPDIFLSEIANGLASAERPGRIRTGEAFIFFHDVIQNCPAIRSTSQLLIRAIEIALSTREAVYDCIYVALAEQEGCEIGERGRSTRAQASAVVPIPASPRGHPLKTRPPRPRASPRRVWYPWPSEVPHASLRPLRLCLLSRSRPRPGRQPLAPAGRRRHPRRAL